MSKEILKGIINEFSIEKFIHFFRVKNSKLNYPNDPLNYDDEKNNPTPLDSKHLTGFTEGRKLAQGILDDGKLIVCSFKVNKDLTERSGKKAQYTLGKKILKDQNADAGIFIFYDAVGKFRFSLIYANYLEKHRDWSNFRRFTYFVSKEQTYKTFLQRIGEGNLSTIEKIKEVFSVEPVTKQFFSELQTWYFWAMDRVKFPDDFKYSNNAVKDKEIRNATNLIRLITRLIFIWFLKQKGKQKGLIPEDLFSKKKLKNIVRDFMKDKESANFYNAILQNLFFGTLNQKMNERKFTEESGFQKNRKEYGVKNLYRYRDKFLISKGEVLKLFKDIPFLNGGLFDCLDKEDETGKVIYIDGFSRNKNKIAIIPDYLFFQENEERVDFSKYRIGKNKPVKGLIEIFNSYNFTIDENTPIDQEIALDPELLGKVFENLLASYNPETATTARKATGSYYTPREIVDYMVESSLYEYLKSAVPESNLSIPAQDLYTFFNPQNEINIYQENLPHWQQKNVWYFVTFRLADSLPAEVVKEIKIEREAWLKKNDKDNLTKEQKIEYYKLFSERIEKLLDAGGGSCILKEERVAKIIVNALNHFNNTRYILDEWVIMPNHIHVLVKPLGENRLDEILHSWKSYTANEINKLTGHKGQLWMHESYDHIVRNEKAFESIRNYIKQNPEKAGLKLPDYCYSYGAKGRSKDASVTLLLSYSEDIPEFSEAERKKIISAIDEIKILDPACGSGAFPMGILHKLVYILQKLDPENKYWYELQYQKALKESEEVFKQGNKDQREERLKEINEAFDEGINYPDYARKLYLIENCIYGVDIQPIATQISKLRFFISLVLEQKIDEKRDNFGIRPLPNLETKFVSANTLIGIQKPMHLFYTDKIKNLEDKIKSLRHKYFQAKTHREKIDYQNKDRGLRELLAKELRSIGFSSDSSKKIAKFDLYDQNASADWFDPEWMFGVKDGFDIVIANPPYMKERDNKRVFEIINNANFGKKYHQGKMDYWYYFLHKAIDISKKEGIISYITSRYWLNSVGASKLIQRVRDELSFVNLVDIGKLKVFDKVAGQHMIAVYSKDRNHDKFIYKKLENDISDIDKNVNTENIKFKYLLNKNIFTDNNEIVLESDDLNLQEVVSLGSVTDISQGVVEATDKISRKQLEKSKRKDVSAGDGVFVIAERDMYNLKLNKHEKSIIKKYLDPRDVLKYCVDWNNKYLIYSDKKIRKLIKSDPSFINIKKHLDDLKEFITSSNKPYGLHRPRGLKYFSRPKIIFKNMFVNNEFAYDEEGFFVGFSFSLIISKDKNYSLKYILAILNSKFALNWFYKHGKKRGAGVDIGVEKLRTFPIKKISKIEQKPFIELVDKILAITSVTQPSRLRNDHKQDACGYHSTKIKEYEHQIDQMVYKLYGLTEEKIKLVEKE